MKNAIQCRYCGGFNVTYNVETGNTICHDCPENKQIPHKGKLVEFEEIKKQAIEKQEAEFEQAKQMGIQINIEKDKKDFNLP